MGGDTLSVTLRVPPVSLRLGHAAGLTPHRGVIQHRVAASLPIKGKAWGDTLSPAARELSRCGSVTLAF